MGVFSFVSGAMDRLLVPLDARMNESGKAAVAIARDLVPKRSGYLESTIGYTYDQKRKLLTLHADASYSAIVEEGSIYMRARPYLRPALNEIGRIWGGNTQISYPNAYALSGKKGDPEVARYNRSVAKRLHRGAAGRAKVRYQHNSPVARSREHFRVVEPLLDPTTPLI